MERAEGQRGVVERDAEVPGGDLREGGQCRAQTETLALDRRKAGSREEWKIQGGLRVW